MPGLALVTGATGFVGSHLVDKLLAEGFRVRCLVRRPPPYEWLGTDRVDLAIGSLADTAFLERAVSQVDYVYHAAGVTWAPRARDFWRDNVETTRHLLDAVSAGNRGLRRFVYVSSQSAAGPSLDGVPRNESHPPRPITVYGESKLAAERLVLEKSAEIPTVILRPSAVYGPRDRAFLAIFKLIARKMLIQFGSEDRLVSFCHVADLANALVQAGDHSGDSGGVYFIAEPEPRLWSKIENIVADLLGVRPRKIKVGRRLITLMGFAGQLYGVLLSKPVQLNRMRVKELLQPDWSLDTGLAQRELGFEADHSIDTAMQALIRWYRQNDWL